MPFIRPGVELSAELDKQHANPDHLEAFEPTMFRWSKSVREAIGLPMAALADALDCDLIYGFMPREPLSITTERVISDLNKARRAKRKLPRRV